MGSGQLADGGAGGRPNWWHAGKQPINPVFDPFGETPARPRQERPRGCGETIRALDETIIGGRRSHPETNCQAPSLPLVKRGVRSCGHSSVRFTGHIGARAYWKCEAIIATLATHDEDTPLCPPQPECHRIQITVVFGICHTIGATIAQAVDTLPDPVCREVIVIKNDMAMQACMLSQPALAEWKDRSIYRGASWWISRLKCVPGDYVPKERV
jgi:hypothetical protein